MNLGDITKIDGKKIHPVDVITFGFPCQSISLAGKREGVKHAEHGHEKTTASGLFYEAVRVIKEMLEATNGEYPKYAIAENVFGLFSSQKGWDFYDVITQLARIKDKGFYVPRCEEIKKGKPTGKLVWRKSGAIVADGFSIAWRTHDAQHWGVAQRRRRVSIVIDFRGSSAPEILFVEDGLRRNYPQSGCSWERATTSFKGCVGVSDRKSRLGDGASKENVGVFPFARTLTGEIAGTLDANYHKGTGERNGVEREIVFSPFTVNQMHESFLPMYEKASTFVKSHHKDPSIVAVPLVFENHPNDSRVTESNDCCSALTSRMGTGGGNVPFVAFPYSIATKMQSQNIGKNVSCPLSGSDYKEPQAVFNPIILDRASFNQGKNAQYDFQILEDGVCATIVAKGPHAVLNECSNQYLVRRLTQTECERLQGYPDGYTNIGDWEDQKGKKRKIEKSDGARYKALGNSIALPYWKWQFENMRSYLPEKATLGSFFDGIGGFPICFNSIYGENATKWTSEIEDFPIAVVAKRIYRKA